MYKKNKCKILIILLVMGISSTDSFSFQVPREVSRADFVRSGLTWPLTVNAGRLGCTGFSVWFQTKDGITYGLNGPAQNRYRQIKEIWSVDEKLENELRAVGAGDSDDPLRIGIGDMIQEGLKLCR